MTDILCIEVDAVGETGRTPLAPEGPFSLLARTGRWAVLRDEGLDRIKLSDETKRQIRADRKAFLLPDAFTDFFGPAMELDDDQDHVVRV